MLFSYLSLFAITPGQLKVLQTIRDVARTVPDSTGLTYEDTLSAICLTESSAGRDSIGDLSHWVSVTSASLGVFQIQIATVRYVSNNTDSLSWTQKLPDTEIANMLLSDVVFSAKIAANYLVILHRQRGQYVKVVSGYNGGMINYPYYNRVMKNMRLVKRLVAKGVIT